MKEEASQGVGLKRKRPARQYDDAGYDDRGGSSIEEPSDDPNNEGGHISWHTIRNDYRQGANSRILYYLASLGPGTIPALIEGNLPRKMQDTSFAEEYGPHLRPRATQGTYTAYLAAADPRRNTQAEQTAILNIGRAQTLSELQKVAHSMREYIDIENANATARAKARAIDRERGGTSAQLDYSRARRYGSGAKKNKFDRHTWFLDNLDRTILNWSKDRRRSHLLDTHMERCYVYVGLSKNVLGRVTGHWAIGKPDSNLFALLAAVFKFHFGNRYEVEDFSYQVLKTTKVEDIGLDEILTSILTSSYLWDGGLNTVHAGVNIGSRKHWEDPAFIARLQENAESISRSGFIQRNIQDSIHKMERVKRALALLKVARAAQRCNLRTPSSVNQEAEPVATGQFLPGSGECDADEQISSVPTDATHGSNSDLSSPEARQLWASLQARDEQNRATLSRIHDLQERIKTLKTLETLRKLKECHDLWKAAALRRAEGK
ncbi:hypothetical protein ABEF95_000450 [Exophiala dermatitidis]